MKTNKVARWSLSILVAYSILATCINLVMLGTTPLTIFPSGHSLIVLFVWLHRAFDSFFILIPALILFFGQCLGFVQVLSKNSSLPLTKTIHLLDIIITLFFLSRGMGIYYLLSIIFDALILSLILIIEKHTQDR